jgi:hypothetical protein
VGQSAALVVALLWVWVLLRQQRDQRRDLESANQQVATYRQRNELLSGALLRSIESASLERSKVSDQRLWLLDSTIRSFVDLLSQALGSALTSPESSREHCERETE